MTGDLSALLALCAHALGTDPGSRLAGLAVLRGSRSAYREQCGAVPAKAVMQLPM